MEDISEIALILKAMGFSIDLLKPHIDEIALLLGDLNHNIINANDVSNQLTIMTNKEKILKRHDSFCGTWLASDGRYKTKVPTADGGRKLIAKATKEQLDNFIIEYYKNLERKPAKPCMRSVYSEWIDYKSKETSYSNACNIQSRWKRYFDKSSIVDIPFEKLTTGAIKKWCVDVIAEEHLTDRQFKDLKSIMNMIFDYAVSFDIIQINLSRQVRGFSERNFKQKEERPVDEIVYNAKAKHSVLKDAFIIQGRPSGNHSIRRTTISELHDAMVIPEDTLKTFAGHKDISTTQKCYIHQIKDITEYAGAFAKVLDS